ncbi:hypothetical protein SOCE26_049290 [Sorangium cellulosum]|uniref:Right handed beta helix domain-containing protein n=1 Tax=Sorangium cellulosum TaxID=56 RepID=A0A2L0EVZ8_SORCE|nr:hypothetical protein [Sorangium cellulosum]AUX43480.1 hypothetical protein SOCE26_049290 [Sorangium cellulosum]
MRPRGPALAPLAPIAPLGPLDPLAALVLVAALMAACAGDPAPAPGSEVGAGAGAGGSAPVFPCPPGEAEVGAGCEPAGVPPGRCGSGFAPDGAQGCAPILPEEPCPPGQMAVPGEAACREVAPCGAGRWGDAPIDEATQFVDAAYAGQDSDGTEARPWTSIQDAILRADEGALVAIAAGSYAEEVTIQGDPVRLWGRCPELVEIVGPPGAMALTVDRGASATEIRSLAVRGQDIGIGVVNATDVVIERVWVHETGDVGLLAAGLNTATSVALRGSLVEHTAGAAVAVMDADVRLEGTVLRDVDVGTADVFEGHSMAMQVESFNRRASGTVRSVVVERVGGLGIRFSSADGVVEDSVFRDVAWQSADRPGAALAATHAEGLEPGTLAVRGSLVERSQTAAIALIGADVHIEATVVRDTGPDLTEGASGIGVGIIVAPSTVDTHPVRATIRHSLVEQSHVRGVGLHGAEVEIDGLRVRGVVPSQPDLGGGIEIQHDQRRANVALRGSVVEDAYGAGIAVFSSDVTVDSTVVRDTRPLPSRDFGRGINVSPIPGLGERGSVRLRNARLERNLDGGLVVIDSDATVESTAIVDTLGRALDGTNGCGIIAYNDETGQANVLLQDSVIERSAGSGVFNIGATVKIASTTFTCEPLDLATHVDEGYAAVYEDLGGNTCGCEGRTIACQTKPSRFEPPRALPPAVVPSIEP